MEPKFESSGRQYFIPDFYVVGGHGCGRLSLNYYLSWLGLPVLPEHEVFMVPTRDNICFPVSKNKTAYCYGLTVDNLAPTLQPVANNANQIPVIWIMRDPVQMLVSVFNYFLGDAVFGKGNPETLAKDAIIPFFAKHISLCALFATLKKSVLSTAKPFIVQTEDLLADSCVPTLKLITKHLSIPYSKKVENVAKISFNSYENRLWSRQPAKYFPLSALNYIRPVYLAPAKIFDFWYNQWSPAKTMATFVWHDQKITVGMPLDVYNRISGDIPRNFFDNFKINALKNYLEIWEQHCAFTRKLYTQYALTAEKAVGIIIGNQKFRSRFLRLLDYELKDFACEYSHIVKKWEFYNAIR